MTDTRWWWPHSFAQLGSLRLWLAPTFFGFGLGIYPKRGDVPMSWTLGCWPLMLTFGGFSAGARSDGRSRTP